MLRIMKKSTIKKLYKNKMKDILKYIKTNFVANKKIYTLTEKGLFYLIELLEYQNKRTGGFDESIISELMGLKVLIGEKIHIELNDIACTWSKDELENFTIHILKDKTQKMLFDFNGKNIFLTDGPIYFFDNLLWKKIINEEDFSNAHYKEKLMKWFVNCSIYTDEQNIFFRKKKNIVFCPFFVTLLIINLLRYEKISVVEFFEYINSLNIDPKIQFILHYVVYRIAKNILIIKTIDGQKIYLNANNNFVDLLHYIKKVDWNNIISIEPDDSSKIREAKKIYIEQTLDFYTFKEKKEIQDVENLQISDINGKPIETNKDELIEKKCREVFKYEI